MTLQNDDNLKRKLVSTARAIISNHVAMPLGIKKIDRIAIWARQSPTFSSINLEIFQEYSNEVSGIPIGTERLLWDKDALKLQDENLDEITRNYKGRIIDKCFEIIEKFEVTIDSKTDR